MSYAEKIIDKFGGIRPAGRALDLPPSTVQGWKEAGRIPADMQPKVLVTGRELGLDINPDDFFDEEVLAGKVRFA